MSAPALQLPAPGKLNLFLHVTGRRDDGYHTLESLFVPIDRGDTVTLTPRADGIVSRSRGLSAIADEDDLAVRAARRLRAACAVNAGVDIAVSKRLPVGAGLGGGSSDAATVLLGLNRLWNLGLARTELMRIGAGLGADIPFFVFGEPAFARGIGEILEPMSVPPTWFVVVTPPVEVSTALVFSARELTRNSQSAKMRVFPEGYGRNDLQAVATGRFPGIAECLEALASEAPASEARMTGSGASVFGVFSSENLAYLALSQMPRGTTGFVARALNRHPLWSFA
jgi:4-diphosphocytidyl-2-C-methyl-D-erythritol kinase